MEEAARRDGDFIRRNLGTCEPGLATTKKLHQSREGGNERGLRIILVTQPNCLRVRSPPAGGSTHVIPNRVGLSCKMRKSKEDSATGHGGSAILAGERKVVQLVAIVPCMPLAKPGKRATGRNCFVSKSPTRKPTRGKKRESIWKAYASW